MDESPGSVREVGLRTSSAAPVLVFGGFGIVGERLNSLSRGGGSLRDSVFQIPVPQGKLLPPWPQDIEPLRLGLVVVAHGLWSAAGVEGLEPVEARGPPVVSEAFLGRVCGTSFSHDVRRAGLGAGALVAVGVC